MPQPAPGPGTKHKLASLISQVLHPFFLAPLAVALILYLEGSQPLTILGWTSLCTLLLSAPLMAFVIYKVARKQFTDIDVSKREQRPVVYGFAAICVAVCFGALLWLGAPQILVYMFASLFIMGLLFDLTTRYITKASVHAGALTAITVVTAFYSWPWAVVLAAITGAVIWSRLVLKRHTPIEVVTGVLIAGLVSLVTMMLRLA